MSDPNLTPLPEPIGDIPEVIRPEWEIITAGAVDVLLCTDQWFCLLDLVPVKPEEGVKKLQVAVNRETFQIEKVVLFDPYGNVTTLTFSAIELNRDLPDSLFAFKPPAGVEVMDMGKQRK